MKFLMKRNNINFIISKIQQESKKDKFLLKRSYDEAYVVLNSKKEIEDIFHSNIYSKDLQIIKDCLLFKNYEELLKIGLSFIYEKYLKKLEELDIQSSADIEFYKDLVDNIDSEKIPLSVLFI